MKEKKGIMHPHFRVVSYAAFALAGAFFIMSMASLLSGCAPTGKSSQPGGAQDEAVRTEARKQKEAAFATFMKRQDHLYRIAFPLLAEASALNPDEAEPTCGFLVHSIESYKESFRPVAAQYYNLDKQMPSTTCNLSFRQLPPGCARVIKLWA